MSTGYANSDPRSLRLAAAVARVAAALVIVIGLLVLLGWMFDVELLRSLLHPGKVAMNPATAVAFVLSGVSLLCLLRDDAAGMRLRIGLVAAAVIVAIGLLRLIGLRHGLN